MTNPNTGRPPMPHDADITVADKLVDQGVGSYYDIRQRMGEGAQAPASTSTDLLSYYGPEFNPKNGELGEGWLSPSDDQRARNAAGIAAARAALKEAAKAKEQ